MEKVKASWQKAARFKLVLLLLGAISIALILTVISVNRYIKDGVAGLDLSRPGYEKVREQVRSNSDNEQFNATGLIDEAVLDRFEELYETEVSELPEANSFSDTSLSDEQLRLDVDE